MDQSPFAQATGVSIEVPHRFYTWVDTGYNKIVNADFSNHRIDFLFDPAGDYLVKASPGSAGLAVSWGTGSLEVDPLARPLIVAAFLVAVYENGAGIPGRFGGLVAGWSGIESM